MHGFYGVVDSPDSERSAVELALRLVSGGACAIQLRAKRASTRELLALARVLRTALPRGQVPFIVNDRLDVALAAEADGVHLGQDDLSLRDARAVAGRRLLIGVSTHNVAQAAAAAQAGADYLGFGPVFATTTKTNPDPVQGLAVLAEVVRVAAPIPVIAIGGISLAAARSVSAAGAAGACAISAVNGAVDVCAAARAISDAFALPTTRG